ncbi:Golgi-associated RAB2 interactor protein 1A-like [Pantherophis guttatus]|uniref:Golgi-associated RAB2 interactor protein 1A-like n=1 Tax=Pantherophis guttatus TaxID=94885 RepID=A0A6P9BK04_PANGU|nr:Golgi-associated RAB2 interactor protein 1A-like [Pantherophis guttatus]XP_060547614.1 Golgi-associated RAB2 interactor protein 1A-like [Pantherophis guttatus]
MKTLECLLRQGEYEMFQYSPMFESDFFQINKEGNPINVHNKKKVITLGVTSTIPTLPIPNTLLLASSIVSSEEHISKSTSIFHQPLPGKLELKRLFPLCLVKISIHNLEKKQLRLKLVTGRTYYLQLYPTSHQQQDLFADWIKLVQMIRPSSKINFNQQKLENKKLMKHSAPLVPTPKPKSPPLQRESQCAPEKKTKNKKKNKKKSICPVIQNPTTQAKETKKENDPTAVRSKSSPTPEIKPPPLKIENVHEAFYQTPEEKNIAKKLEREKVENPGAGGETENLDINRYRKPVRKNLSSQSRSGHRGAARKPSKIASLFIGCFRSQRKNKRSNKAQNKGKRYRAE